MIKNTCWQGWSCYGLYLKTSEMPILKEGLENLLRKLHSEEGWQIVRGCLNAEGSFTKKYWKSFTAGAPLELPSGNLQLECIDERHTDGAVFVPLFREEYFHEGCFEHRQLFGYVVALEHYGSLFYTAYPAKEDALNEIKRKVEPCLPPVFPWKERLGLFTFAYRQKRMSKNLYAANVEIQGRPTTSRILIYARNKFEAEEKYAECVRRHPDHIPLNNPQIEFANDFEGDSLERPQIKQEMEEYDSATMWQGETL